MYIEQLYTNCLAEAAYYIESEGEAAIIDPIRETGPYIELARSRGASIRYIFETHFHADFVSGHLDLSRKTGAPIIYGPGAHPEFDAVIAGDGQEFQLGKIVLKVLHTPGHTPESSCFLLRDEKGKDHALFSGDTLFIGDVGRPDLAVKSDLSREDLAGMLYDSLRGRVMPLADEVIVYPAHGAGSSCGKNISKETSSTIGEQKKTNYALQPMSREKFIEAVTEGLTAPPKYFFMDALINKKGYESLDEVMNRSVNYLEAGEFRAGLRKPGAVVLDTRKPGDFAEAHVPGAINIGLDGQFAIWAGSLLDPAQTLYIVAPEGREEEAVLRLARVGYEKVGGILKGGFRAWKEAGLETEATSAISPEEFTKTWQGKKVLDVRNENEWATGIVPDAELIPLARLQEQMPQLSKDSPWYVHCAGGYRSMMAASLLSRNGFMVVNVDGGMGKLKEAGLETVEPSMHS